MTNPSATSPLIKTAFLAITLAASSMSSASHAGDFIATMTTQGLSSQLILVTNPGYTTFLEELEQDICQDPAGEFVKMQEEIVAALKLRRQPITDLETDISKLTNEIAKVNQLLSSPSLPAFTRKQNEEKLAKLRKERDEKKADLEAKKKADSTIDSELKEAERILKMAQDICARTAKKPAQAQ